MTEAINIAPFVSGVLGALVGTFVSRMLVQKKERNDMTMQLFNTYNSKEMFNYRKIAWSYLTSEFPLAPHPYHHLFSKRDFLAEDITDAITKIAYFWYSAHILEKRKLLSRVLFKDLFNYQYAHWITALTPLYHVTIEDGRDIPEWVSIFSDVKHDWINSVTYLSSKHHTP